MTIFFFVVSVSTVPVSCNGEPQTRHNDHAFAKLVPKCSNVRCALECTGAHSSSLVQTGANGAPIPFPRKLLARALAWLTMEAKSGA